MWKGLLAQAAAGPAQRSEPSHGVGSDHPLNRVAGYNGEGRRTRPVASPGPDRLPGPEAYDHSASGSRRGLAGGGVSGSGDPRSMPGGGSWPGS